MTDSTQGPIEVADPTRILCLFGSTVLFGQERANVHVLKAVQSENATVLCLAREDKKHARIIRRFLTEQGVAYSKAPYLQNYVPGSVFHVLFLNPIRFVRAYLAFRGVTKRFKPTHIYVFNQLYFLSFLISLLRSRIPIIYRAGDQPIRHNFFMRWLWKRIIGRVTHFVAISDFIGEKLVESGVPRDRVSVIRNTPPARKCPPQPAKKPITPYQILYVGQINEGKGVHLLIEAFRNVLSHYPNARLRIVGRVSSWEGDLWAQNLKNTVESDPALEGIVEFAGETDDVFLHFADSAFLVVPSIFEEPLSNVVGEAKAAGRPSIVFPKGGLPELVVHGEDGFVCHAPTVGALEEAMEYYLSSPKRAEAHGKAALASLDRLGVSQFSRKWIEVFQNH